VNLIGANVTTYSDTTVVAGTTYYYRVRSQNIVAFSATFSNIVSVGTVPLTITTATLATGAVNAPYSQTVAATAGTTSYSWSATGLPSGLTINPGTGVISGTPTAAGTISFTVMVTDANLSTATQALSITIAAAAVGPAAPYTLAARIASATRITLTWIDASTNETSFAVWSSVNGAAATQVATVTRTLTQGTAVGGTVTYNFNNTGFLAGDTYAFYVTAVNAAGPSAASNTASVSFSAPAAPINLAAAISSTTRIALSWTDASSNETSFAVWSSMNGAPATQVGTVTRSAALGTAVGGAVTYNARVVAGNTYAFYVTAVNSVGVSAPTATVTVAFTAPIAPTLVTVTATRNAPVLTSTRDTAMLTWTDVAGETSYTIQRATDALFTVGLTTTTGIPVNTISASTGQTRLTLATTYYYRVGAVNAVGTAWSNVMSVLTP